VSEDQLVALVIEQYGRSHKVVAVNTDLSMVITEQRSRGRHLGWFVFRLREDSELEQILFDTRRD
jgi:hypothetical protein